MEWLPSFTMPSSMVQDSCRECWKYRSAKSTPGPSNCPNTRSRSPVASPAGASRRDWARTMGSGMGATCSGEREEMGVRAGGDKVVELELELVLVMELEVGMELAQALAIGRASRRQSV